MIALSVRVYGLVQGVGFRWFVSREADRLGLAGWVRNEPDGTVLMHLEGPERSVDEMLAWLEEGPPTARVEDVASAEADLTGADGFEIRR